MTDQDEFSEIFYQWESRLRGWQIYSHTIQLEPPLIPLWAYFEPDSNPVTDTGKTHTLLSGIAEDIGDLFSPKPVVANIEPERYEFNDQPDIFTMPDDTFVTYQLALPTDFTGSLTTYRNFLQSLRYATHHLSFEVIGTAKETVIQLCAWYSDSEKLLAQIRAHLPEATVTTTDDAIDFHAFSDSTLVVDFGLEQAVMYPLEKLSDLKHDPLTALVGSLDILQGNEQCLFQILFTHTNEPWASELRNRTQNTEGGPLFGGEPELTIAAKDKTSSPLYTCVIRIAVIAGSNNRRWDLARSIGGALAQYDAPAVNNLMPLDNEGYDHYDHWRDVINRTTHRSGMLLSLDELVGLLHYPDEVVKSDKLSRQRIKTKAAPDLAIGHELILGLNEHRGNKIEVSLSTEQRTRHMYVVGASGTGKSTLLLNCIKQDMENNQGICVLDPHGDLIDQALALVPEDRIDDVILLDPSDEDYPIGLNIFDAHSSLEKTLLASDLTAVFERLSTTWGDQMTTVLSQGVLAMLESTEGGTLHDLRRFLIEKDYREEFLKTVQDPEVVYYWQKQFPLLSGRPQASVLTRLDTFLRPKPIRHMVIQKKSAIDFAKVMDQGKILLAKLSHGGIGEENAYLLGALLASKIHQTALARQAVSQEQRRPFWLYIDEFQNFLTPSIAQTLSGARKYSLGMVLGHQELTQLSLANKAVAASVIANPYTRICFRMGDRDARTLSEGFSTFDSKDLQSLGIGEAIGRIEQAKFDFSLKTYPLPDIDEKDVEHKINAIRNASRVKYATPLTDEARKYLENLTPITKTQSLGSNDELRVRYDDLIGKDREEKSTDKTVEAVVKPKKNAGKGGQRHKEIQHLLQKTAHDRGFGATIEHHIGDGQHVDLLINTGEKQIACEISVSTSVEHELGNIRKCLKAGFREIFLVSDDADFLDKVQASVSKQLPKFAELELHFLSPENVFKIVLPPVNPPTSETVRGYQVKRKWGDIRKSECDRRESAIAKMNSN